MALQQPGQEGLPQGISLTRYVWAADSEDRQDWLWCYMKLLVSDLAEGFRVVRVPWARQSQLVWWRALTMVNVLNDGECSPADLAHSHVPRAESRDLLLAWVWCSSEWNLSKPVWNIQWVCKRLCLRGIFDLNDCRGIDGRESVIFSPYFLGKKGWDPINFVSL